jgi:nitronate monooxygenase
MEGHGAGAANWAAVRAQLSLPVVAAPMFLVSGPDLVIEACRSGIIGSFPTMNARTSEDLDDWLAQMDLAFQQIREETGRSPIWAPNLVVHRTNSRLQADIDALAKYRPPIVITALGSPAAVIEQVQAWGGLVFADVNSVPFAKRAAESGVDGLVLVCAGAGGHTGHLNPFAFLSDVRAFFDGPIVIAGGITTGAMVRSVEVMGAELAYIGTPFIATPEAIAPQGHKDMVVDCDGTDLVPTDAFTGATANMLKPSIVAAGYDPAAPSERPAINFDDPQSEKKAWRDIWAAGQAVGQVGEIKTVEERVRSMHAEYRAALS